ncbi:MAG: O-antigen ligase family protein [Desulfosarcina sp.]
MNLINILSFFIIGTIPILFAAVQPWIWSWYGGLMIVAYTLSLWTVADPIVSIRFTLPGTLVALFFVWSLFLCLPAPYALISFLSPERANLLSQASTLTGGAPVWEPVGYAFRPSLAWWVFLLALALFYRVMRRLCADRATLKRLVFVMIGIGLLEAAYGLIQSLVPSLGVLWVDYILEYVGTARGTFINRNSFAAFIGMIWPMALAVTLAMTDRARSLRDALGSDHLNRQAIMALGLIVLLLALIFTRSRGGILSGLAGFLAFSILVRPGMKNRTRQTRWLLGGIAALLLVYTAAIGVEPILVRFLKIADDSGSRVDIWRDSWQLVKDHPPGIGLRNYEDVFQVYNRSLATDKTVVHAHNDYLQVLAETGWIGFSSIVGAFFIFLVSAFRRIRRLDFHRDPLRPYLAVGAFSGLVSISVHSLFDFNLQIPANCVYFVVLLAILSACTPAQKTIDVEHRTSNFEF